MDLITSFLSNPLVGLVGYILSVLAAVIAFLQYFGRSKAEKDLKELRVEFENYQNTISKNKVYQGSKSQYFQDNSGFVNIDNRG